MLFGAMGHLATRPLCPAPSARPVWLLDRLVAPGWPAVTVTSPVTPRLLRLAGICGDEAADATFP
jgi:hypothetical protein